MNQKHLKHLKHFGVLPMSYEEEDTCISYVYVHMRRRIQTPETFRSPSRSLTRILKSHSPSAFIRYTQWKEAFSEFLYESPCPYSWRRVSLFRTWNYASAPTCLGVFFLTRRVSLFRTWNYASAPTCLGFCLFCLKFRVWVSPAKVSV